MLKSLKMLNLSRTLIPIECWHIVFRNSDLGDVVRMSAVSRPFLQMVSDYLSTAGGKRALVLRVWTKLSPSILKMPRSFYDAFPLQQGGNRWTQLNEIERFIAIQRAHLSDATPAQIHQLALATLPSGDWFHDEIQTHFGHYGFSLDAAPKELSASFQDWDPKAPPVSCRLRYEALRDSQASFRSVLFKVRESRNHSDLNSVRLLGTIGCRLNRGLPVDDYLKLLKSHAIPKMEKNEVLLQVHFFINLARLYVRLNKWRQAKAIILKTIEKAKGIRCPQQKGYAWAFLASLLKDEEIVARLVICLEKLIAEADDKQIYLFWMVHVLLHQGKEGSEAFAKYLPLFQETLKSEGGLNTINMFLRAANIDFLGKSFSDPDRGINYLTRALQLAKSSNKLEEKLLILSDWASVMTIKFALERVADRPLRSKVLLEMAKLGRLDEAAELIRDFNMHQDPLFLSEFRRYAPNQASQLVRSSHKRPKKAIQQLYKPKVPFLSIMWSIELMRSVKCQTGKEKDEAQARRLLREMKPSAKIVRWQAALGDIPGVMATLAALPEDPDLKIIAVDELARRLCSPLT